MTGPLSNDPQRWSSPTILIDQIERVNVEPSRGDYWWSDTLKLLDCFSRYLASSCVIKEIHARRRYHLAYQFLEKSFRGLRQCIILTSGSITNERNDDSGHRLYAETGRFGTGNCVHNIISDIGSSRMEQVLLSALGRLLCFPLGMYAVR